MLTGRSLFAGDTVTDVIAAVVTREPDLDALPKATPMSGPRGCWRPVLAKGPAHASARYRKARLELQEEIAGTATEAEAPAADTAEPLGTERRRRTRERWAWAVIAFVAAGFAGALAFVHLREEPEAKLAARFAVDAPRAGLSAPTSAGPSLPPMGARSCSGPCLRAGRE